MRSALHLAAIAVLGRLDFIVDTLPGSTGFTLPAAQAALLQKWKPVCLEAAYIPRHTAFVTQALGAGCRVVEGIEMLFEQGCAQCEIWTRRPAPRGAIAVGIKAFLESQDFGPLPARSLRVALGRGRSEEEEEEEEALVCMGARRVEVCGCVRCLPICPRRHEQRSTA